MTTGQETEATQYPAPSTVREGAVITRPDVWAYKDGLVVRAASIPAYVMVLHTEAQVGHLVGTMNRVDWFDTLDEALDAIDQCNGKVWHPNPDTQPVY